MNISTICIVDEGIDARIAHPPIRVIDIVRAKQRTGMTPEELQAAIGTVSLAQVYAALAHYYANQEEIDAGLARQDAETEAALRLLNPRTPPPPGSNGMAEVFGKWSGDETDKQIAEALERLS